MPTRVLVVEDDERLRSQFRLALMTAGFITSSASNAVEALSSIDRQPPDAVVLEISLPLFSGVLVRQQLRARAHTRDIPVIVVTDSPNRFDSLNVNCVLRKPVSPEQVVEALRECLDTQTQGQ